MAYTRAKVVEEIGASADRVFGEIGAFNNLTVIMAGAITRSTLNKKGTVRTLKVKGIKGSLDETLLKYDTATRTQIYTITADPDDMVPFGDYTATIKVKPITSRRCAVEWTSRFVPKKGKTKAECLEFVEGIYGPESRAPERCWGSRIAFTQACHSRAVHRRGAGRSPLRDRGPRPAPSGPLRRRSHAASAAPTSAGVRRPSPTSTRVPTIARTWWWRKERAQARIAISSPLRLTARLCRVRTGEFAWQWAARKVVKSWVPSSRRAASAMVSLSSGRGRCHARLCASASGALRLTIQVQIDASHRIAPPHRRRAVSPPR